MKKLIMSGLLILSSLSSRGQTTPPADLEIKKLNMVEVIKTPLPFTNSVRMEMIPVAGGAWAGKYEVTQAAYLKVMAANPSHFPGTNNPVDSVSWNSAIQFCQKLTLIERKESNLPTNFVYTLPTEAQWMILVANASLDDAVTSYGSGGSHPTTLPVGSRKPNALGLYDMRGNVMEFTLDWNDPTQTYRVLRGGAFDDWFEVNLRNEFRHYTAGPDDAQPDYGFRCVLMQLAQPAK